MERRSIPDQLDCAIDALIAGDSGAPAEPGMSGLLEVAAELRYLPRADFKARLKADLQEQAFVMGTTTLSAHSPTLLSTSPAELLPTLFGGGYGSYPMQRGNFFASFLLHAAAVALILTSGIWFVQHRQGQPQQQVVTALTAPSDLEVPIGKDTLHGGGGGGDHDKLEAPKGRLPKFAMEQLTPPAMVIRGDHPKLTAEPTVIMPPQVKLPFIAGMPNVGDPLSRLPAGPPSNGTGGGGGIGSGYGGGIGSGVGGGVGPGMGGGYGGGVFKVGGGVSAPVGIYTPDPEYSEEARRLKYQGTVVLWLIVGPDGRPRDMKVARSLGMGLDQKAIEAVRRWRFEPATKDGQPVAVQINVEVNFRLY